MRLDANLQKTDQYIFWSLSLAIPEINFYWNYSMKIMYLKLDFHPLQLKLL